MLVHLDTWAFEELDVHVKVLKLLMCISVGQNLEELSVCVSMGITLAAFQMKIKDCYNSSYPQIMLVYLQCRQRYD